MVEHGNDKVDDKDHPEVALGVTLPVLSRVEIGERAEQQYREREAQQVEPVEGQWRREEDIAQQHRDAHQDGAPVVELVGGDEAGVEEVHPDHRQTGQIDDVENQLGPCVAQPELKDAIDHDAHREHASHSGNADVENLSILFESCLHKSIVLLEFEDVAEAGDGEDATHFVVDALDIDVTALILCILQDTKEDTQTG